MSQLFSFGHGTNRYKHFQTTILQLPLVVPPMELKCPSFPFQWSTISVAIGRVPLPLMEWPQLADRGWASRDGIQMLIGRLIFIDESYLIHNDCSIILVLSVQSKYYANYCVLVTWPF